MCDNIKCDRTENVTMKVNKKHFSVNEGKEKSRKWSETEEQDSEATKRREEKIIHSCCSLQSRIGPPEYRKWRRIHGLQFPLHPQQIVGWIILLSIGGATFFVLIPALRPFFRECLFIVLAILFSLHILSHLAALLLDPADPELRSLKVNFTVPEFDRTKHSHVIENGRCHLCNIKTSSSRTKHCSVCNKCIDHFDHHCKWLNHCIGGRNYPAFLICVISAVAASLVVVGVSVLEIIYYYVDPGLLNIFVDHRNGTTSQFFLPGSVFLGIISILGLLTAATAGLLLHLCLFHCYITVLGITTYEYIRNYRQESSAQRFFPLNCSTPKSDVLTTTQVESAQKTRLKFKSCYYSCCRPPEDEDRTKCCFRGERVLKRSETRKKRTLERQDTDPEFIDKVIKPFLVTLNDERSSESKTKNLSQNHSFKGRKYCFRICSSSSSANNSDESNQKCSNKSVIHKSKNFRLNKIQFWSRTIKRRHSTGSIENTLKLKPNRICPSTAKLDGAKERISALNFEPEILADRSYSVIKSEVLSESKDFVKKPQSLSELKELRCVLNLVEQSNLALQSNMKPNLRKPRKMNILKKPQSPPLSPIRESGLSNPESPRVDLIMPPTPVFIRPSTPETSTIFLSNPSSSCSSDDENDVVCPPIPTIQRPYNNEDILKTPQLPRKMFITSKKEQIFVLNSPKMKFDKWVDVEIKNGI